MATRRDYTKPLGEWKDEDWNKMREQIYAFASGASGSLDFPMFQNIADQVRYDEWLIKTANEAVSARKARS